MKIDTFMKRAVGHVDAATFLAEHRNFLCTFPTVMPVLAMLEEKTIFPTGALQQIVTLMALEKDPLTEKPQKVTEKINRETGEITKVIEKVTEPKKRGLPKRYQMFLFEKDGESEVCTAVYDADLYTEVMKIADRKLFQNESSVYIDAMADGVTTRIHRVDAMRRILGHGPGGKTATKKTAKTSAGLGHRCTAKNFVAKFSRG
jgi:hypothetical protein